MKENDEDNATGTPAASRDNKKFRKPKEKLNAAGFNEFVEKLKTVQLRSSRRSLRSAYYMGKLLIRIQDSLEHGDWGEWLKKNTKIKQRSANDWMTLARQPRIVWEGRRKNWNITKVLRAMKPSVKPTAKAPVSTGTTPPEQKAGATADSGEQNTADRSGQTSGTTTNVIKQVRRYLEDIEANGDSLELASAVAICEKFIERAKVRIEKDAA